MHPLSVRVQPQQVLLPEPVLIVPHTTNVATLLQDHNAMALALELPCSDEAGGSRTNHALPTGQETEWTACAWSGAVIRCCMHPCAVGSGR